MGFLSSIGKVAAGGLSALGGGQTVNTPATGFYALPQPVQNSLNSVVSVANKFAQNPQIYAPAAQNTNQTQAYNLSQPLDSAGISALVQQYLNPYDQSVTNEINKQAVGQNSTLNQAATEGGTFGSNRQLLGANDIDESRLNQINTFKQGAYQSALQTALQQRQQDLSNLDTTGNERQAYDTSVKQAPLLGQQGLQAALSTYLKGFTPGSSPASSVTQGGGLSGILNTVKTGAQTYAALSAFSDMRLKENIKPAGTENGHKIYSFNYKGTTKKRIGVMAQEVLKTHPEAVSTENGYLKVDYGKIGVTPRVIN